MELMHPGQVITGEGDASRGLARIEQRLQGVVSSLDNDAKIEVHV